MNASSADFDQHQDSERDDIRRVQELIDLQSPHLPNDFVVDGDAELCLQLLQEATSVDLHLVPVVSEVLESAVRSSKDPPRSFGIVQSWNLKCRAVLGAGGFAIVLAVETLQAVKHMR